MRDSKPFLSLSFLKKMIKRTNIDLCHIFRMFAERFYYKSILPLNLFFSFALSKIIFNEKTSRENITTNIPAILACFVL